MKYSKINLVLYTILFSINFEIGWAAGESEEKPLPPAKRIKKALSTEILERGQVSPSSGSETSIESPSPFQRSSLFKQFSSILQSEPVPLPMPQPITAQEEDQRGSRKWVQFYTDRDIYKQVHDWHKKMHAVITALTRRNTMKLYYASPTNFAVARLVIFYENGSPSTKDIPYFFVSGWPGDGKKNPSKSLSKDLKQGMEKDSVLSEYQAYGVRFVSKKYEDGKESSAGPAEQKIYAQEIHGIFEAEKKQKESIPHKDRLDIHSKLTGQDDVSILYQLYCHSEQGIWIAVKEMLERNKKKIKYAIIDVCSRFDLCWCCADTLSSCCHTNHFNVPVYVRATGCNPYFDNPLRTNPSYSLRTHRADFSGYASGQSYVMSEEDEARKPFIAHATVVDFQ